MGDHPTELSVGAALEQVAGQLRAAKMLPANQQLSIAKSFATPGFYRLDKVPKAVFLFGISEGKGMEQQHISRRSRLAATTDIHGSHLLDNEKRWLLKKAGVREDHNPYRDPPAPADAQPLESVLQDGRVLRQLVLQGDIWMIQASPVGSHDQATYKVLKAYIHSKRIHGSQAYQTPFLSAAHQKLHEAVSGGAASCPHFVLMSGKPHWSLLPFYQRALELGRVAGHDILPGHKQGRAFVFGCRRFPAAEVRQVREALERHAQAAAAALQVARQPVQQAQQAHQTQQQQVRQAQQAWQQPQQQTAADAAQTARQLRAQARQQQPEAHPEPQAPQAPQAEQQLQQQQQPQGVEQPQQQAQQVQAAAAVLQAEQEQQAQAQVAAVRVAQQRQAQLQQAQVQALPPQPQPTAASAGDSGMQERPGKRAAEGEPLHAAKRQRRPQETQQEEQAEQQQRQEGHEQLQPQPATPAVAEGAGLPGVQAERAGEAPVVRGGAEAGGGDMQQQQQQQQPGEQQPQELQLEQRELQVEPDQPPAQQQPAQHRQAQQQQRRQQQVDVVQAAVGGAAGEDPWQLIELAAMLLDRGVASGLVSALRQKWDAWPPHKRQSLQTVLRGFQNDSQQLTEWVERAVRGS